MVVDLEALRLSLEAPHRAGCEHWHSTAHTAIVFWRAECLQWLCWKHHGELCAGCAMHD